MRVLCVSFVPFWCVQTPWDSGCDVWWDEAMRDSPEECEPEWLDAEDPLFILYTSGSTGKPKVRRRCMKPVLQQKHRGNLQETKKEMLIFSETTSFKSQCLLFYPAKPGMVLNAYFYIICCEIVQIVGFLLLRGNYRKSKAPQLHVTRILCVLYVITQNRSDGMTSALCLTHTHTCMHVSSASIESPLMFAAFVSTNYLLIHVSILGYGTGCSPHCCRVSALHITDLQVCFRSSP